MNDYNFLRKSFMKTLCWIICRYMMSLARRSKFKFIPEKSKILEKICNIQEYLLSPNQIFKLPWFLETRDETYLQFELVDMSALQFDNLNVWWCLCYLISFVNIDLQLDVKKKEGSNRYSAACILFVESGILHVSISWIKQTNKATRKNKNKA